jgi:copper chaperone CopZ
MSKIIKKKLKIKGMNCTACAINIDFDLEDIGVNSKTNYAKQESEIEFDEEKISIDQIIETIKKTGYQAEVTN